MLWKYRKANALKQRVSGVFLAWRGIILKAPIGAGKPQHRGVKQGVPA
jgi:hypothetical protein